MAEAIVKLLAWFMLLRTLIIFSCIILRLSGILRMKE